MKVIDDIIKAEGDTYTNHPADRGGPTKYGITLKTYQKYHTRATAKDVENMSRKEAEWIYEGEYVRPFMFLNGVVFNFIVNAAVQHGVSRAIKMLQEACGATVDGKMGPITEQKAVSVKIEQLVAIRCKYYANILMKAPSQRVFAAGWLSRIAHDLS
jgi:lysozyme family protein